MKVYIDLQKLAISKVVDGTSPEYAGDINSNVFEILFFNYDNTNWFPTMSQLAPNGREAGDFEADSLGVGETHDYTEDGVNYQRFTFTMGNAWVLMKGRSNLFVWYNVLNGAVLKKCVGKLNVMLNESSDNYFIYNPVFNPAVKSYIDSVASDIEDELNDKVDAQNATIASLSQASPSVFDTAANIQALQENKGVAVATDTGYIWYWSTTVTPNAYVSSGLQYNSPQINDGTITPDKTSFMTKIDNSLFDTTDITSTYNCSLSSGVLTTNNLNYNYTFCLNCSSGGIANGDSLQAGTYYLSFKIKGSVTGGGLSVRCYDNNGNRVNATTLYANVPIDDYGNMMVKFTLSSDVDNFGFMFVNAYNGIIVYNCKDFFMSDNQDDIISYLLNNNIFINSDNIVGSFKLTNMASMLEEYNVFDVNNAIVGRYNINTGAYYPSDTNKKCSEFIPVNILKNKVVEVTGTQQVYINEYNSSKVWLRGVATNYQSVDKTYNISSDAVYITLSVPNDYPEFSLIGYRFNKDIEKPKYDIKRILCIGDSLTQGVDYNDHVITEGYPYFLEKDFYVKSFNHGFMGTTASTWYSTRMQYVDFNYTFDVALIMLGTNGGLTDTLDTDVIPYNDYNNFANTNTGNYCKIIEKIMQQSPKTQIVLMIPPYNYFNEEKHSVLLTAVNVIPKIAELYSLPIIDLYRCSGMNYRNGEIFRPHDNLHFNAKGYHKMATYIGNQLKALYSYFYDSDVYSDEHTE